MAGPPPGGRWRDALWRSWWAPGPTGLSVLLAPLSWLYGALARLQRARTAAPWRAPCPVVVVGNLIVGGAGKTPTVIALVRALREAGYQPGVVSRGYGRRTQGVTAVTAERRSAEVGDEPLLIHRATGAPVMVGERRVDAARALLAAHPDVDLLIADDGLQHAALARDVELWVFDDRGAGNGALLPAGPLRQPLPTQVPPNALVLYNAAAPSTPLPGALLQRRLAGAVALAQWQAGAPMQPDALRALVGRPVLAVAGIAAPQRFFDMLTEAGLSITPMPLPDHAALDPLPWPPDTADLVCTEKDAIKIDPSRCGSTRVWVVGLDLALPAALLADLRQRLAPPRSHRRPP